MKIEIKNRYNGNIILCGEYESIKECLTKNKAADLRYADLRYADLRYADLRYADLRSADLSDADLRYANLSSADLRYADLSDADLRYADLRDADLSSADLRSADLRYADLRSADLRYADLRDADLSSADTNKRYIQISCIGSRQGRTTYCFEDDVVFCGCWKGGLTEFKERVEKAHKNNKQFLAEYLGFIEYINKLKKLT
jgi:uncharacterized protein YjbI with pentapeptide repeats